MSDQPNVQDMEDAWLQAKAEVDSFADEFERIWYAPYYDTEAVTLWMAQGESFRQEFRNIDPQQAAYLDSMIAGGNYANK